MCVGECACLWMCVEAKGRSRRTFDSVPQNSVILNLQSLGVITFGKKHFSPYAVAQTCCGKRVALRGTQVNSHVFEHKCINMAHHGPQRSQLGALVWSLCVPWLGLGWRWLFPHRRTSKWSRAGSTSMSSLSSMCASSRRSKKERSLSLWNLWVTEQALPWVLVNSVERLRALHMSPRVTQLAKVSENICTSGGLVCTAPGKGYNSCVWTSASAANGGDEAKKSCFHFLYVYLFICDFVSDIYYYF